MRIFTIGNFPFVPVATPAALEAAFVAGRPCTVGLEEELMLLHPETLDLLPRADDVRARGGEVFRREMPAAQVEIAVPPASTVPEAAAALRDARLEAARAAEGIGLLAGAGAHPFSAPLGVLNEGERYDAIAAEYRDVARAQLCFGLHVHAVAGGPARSLAAYHEVREHLPLLAALAAAAPFYAGRDTGLASVRPKVCDLLPRQGVPPALASFDTLADHLRWGAAAGFFPDAASWWWEARLHPRFGTVEVRCPDAQATVGESAAIAAVVHCLVARAGARHDAGEPAPPPAETWRVAENRWSACRHGVHGTMADVRTGRARPTAELLADLLADLAPYARRLDCAGELDAAHGLIARPVADRHRAAAADGGPLGLARWLAGRFLE